MRSNKKVLITLIFFHVNSSASIEPVSGFFERYVEFTVDAASKAVPG